MNSGYTIGATVAFVILVMALLLSCEDSAIIAPEDAKIILTADPGTVVLDSENGVESGISTIAAQVFDASGFPVANVAVSFSASSGILASRTNACIDEACSITGSPCTRNVCVNSTICSITGSACETDNDCEEDDDCEDAVPPRRISTDANGNAVDLLVVRVTDPVPITVTAFSGTLSQTVEVNASDLGVNEPPVAAIFAIPPGSGVDCTEGGPSCEQQVGRDVIFSGALSSDDERITCFRWIIGGNYWAQGPSETRAELSFDSEQNVSVDLFLSDEANPTPTFCTECSSTVSQCWGIEDDLFFNAQASLLNYRIVCANDAPVVQVSPDQGVPLSGVPPAAQVNLSGSATDAETAAGNLDYTWDCGNGSGPQSGQSVVCIYTTIGTKTATFTVTDDGNPSGSEVCVQSTSADVSIVVSDPSS